MPRRLPAAKPFTATYPLSEAQRVELLESVEGLVVTIVNEKCSRHLNREDIMQECRLALWKQSAAFDPARCSPGVWASVVCRNVCHYRGVDDVREFAKLPTYSLGDVSVTGRHMPELRDHRGPAGSDPDPLADTLAAFVRSATELAAADMMAGLTPKSRQLLELAAVERLTAPEIAIRLGQPVKSVRRNLQVLIATLGKRGLVTPAALAEAGVTADDLKNCRHPVRHSSQADRIARRQLVAEAGPGFTAKELADLFGVTESTIFGDRRAIQRAKRKGDATDVAPVAG